MELLQTIALLCQLNGSGADSIFLINAVERKQLECQQYYINCLDPVNANYKPIAKCIKDRKL